jgi:hypothetical protein
MNKETLKVGNNAIEAEADFADGYSNGNLYYYDRNHQLRRPLTCEAISAFMAANLSNQRASGSWNAGFVLGWTVALCENDPAYFYSSLVIPEPVAGGSR